MRTGLLSASVVSCLLLLTLVPTVCRAADSNTDAYFVKDDFSDRAVKGEDSAKFDYLEVKAVVYVNVSGFYNLSASLEFQQTEIARTSNNTFLNPGTHAIFLHLRNREIYSSQAVGNFIVNLSLSTPNFRLTPIQDTYLTGFYHYADFNPDYFAPYPPGSEFGYTDGDFLTISNSNITFIFDKKHASMTYYFTRDKKEGKNGRFTVTYLRVLAYHDSGNSFFQKNDITAEAVLENGTWKNDIVEKGIHRAYGPYLRFNITYDVDMIDIFNVKVSTLEVTFSFYFTGNPHTSVDKALTVAGATQAELDLCMTLSNTITSSGLVLEQVVQDTTRNHDIQLQDWIGTFRLKHDDKRLTESRLSPFTTEEVPKLSFINRWEPVIYARYNWVTAARSQFGNASSPVTTDVSYIPQGNQLRLFLAYHVRDSTAKFLSIQGTLEFGLEGTTPPPDRPVPPPPPRHDPLLYLLGSFLALAIILLTMRLRTRSYIEEDEAIEKIEAQELAKGEEEHPEAPFSIEEKAIGEEEEWRTRWEKREGEPGEGPPQEEEPPQRNAKEQAAREGPESETAKGPGEGAKTPPPAGGGGG
jgi:hypothetical protein